MNYLQGVNKETIHAALRQPTPVRVKSAPTLKWASVAIVIRPNLDLLLIRRAERAGDPWFRKTLTQPDSFDTANMLDSQEKLTSLLAGNVMPQNR